MIRSARSFITAAAASLLIAGAFLTLPSAYAESNPARYDNAAAYAEEYTDTDIVVKAEDNSMEYAWLSVIGLCLFAACVGGHAIWKKLKS